MRKNQTKKISVAIVTKNRASDLLNCLASLMVQTRMPDELIIVDNNSSDQTRQMIKNLQKNSILKIKYVLEKAIGYPIFYNRGIDESTNNLLSFIDDDCIADSDWLKEMEQGLFTNQSKNKRNSKNGSEVVAVVGQSKTQYKNFYSHLTHFKDFIWKKNATKKTHVLDLEVLDNKNILYDKKWLKAHYIKYDVDLIKGGFSGACEDSDLGMQIQKTGGSAVCWQDSIVYHKDPSDFVWYWKKVVQSARAHVFYEKKWQDYRKNIGLLSLRRNLPIFDLFPTLKKYFIDYNLSYWWFPGFVLFLAGTFLLIRLIKLYEKIR